jgi:hypothetical protein
MFLCLPTAPTFATGCTDDWKCGALNRDMMEMLLVEESGHDQINRFDLGSDLSLSWMAAAIRAA